MTFNVAVFFFKNSIQEIQGLMKSAHAGLPSSRRSTWENGIQHRFAYGVEQMNNIFKKNRYGDLVVLVPKNSHMGDEWPEQVFENPSANFETETLTSPIAVSTDKSHTPYLTLRVREKATQQDQSTLGGENRQIKPTFITLYPVIPGVNLDLIGGSSYKWVIEGGDHQHWELSNQLNSPLPTVFPQSGVWGQEDESSTQNNLNDRDVGDSFHMLNTSTTRLLRQQQQVLESEEDEDEYQEESSSPSSSSSRAHYSRLSVNFERHFEILDAIISGKHPTLELDRRG